MEAKIAQFEVINNLKHFNPMLLICNICKNWLTPKIYAQPNDGVYCCSVCASKQSEAIHRHFVLETVLQVWKFPCMFNDCDYIEDLVNIHCHMSNCVYQSIKCPFCSMESLAELTIVKHLDEKHKQLVSQMSIDEPLVKLCLEPPIAKKRIIIISFKGHTFIILTENLAFAIGKQSVDVDFDENGDKFMIEFRYNKLETKIRGSTVRLQKLFEDNMQLAPMCVPPFAVDSALPLKVYFNKYEELQAVTRECYVCFEDFTEEVFFCEYNHGVCGSCVRKLAVCASCRTPINKTKVNLRQHLKQVPFPCINSKDDAEGSCIALLRSTDMDQHLARCPYLKVKCIYCRHDVAKCNIVPHLQKHIVVHRNFYEFDLIVEKWICKKGFMRFKQQVLFFVIISSGVRDEKENSQVISEEKRTYYFNVQLLFERNNYQRYRYEFHILKPNGSLFHSFGNVCQQEGDTSPSAQINCNFCKKVMFKRAGYQIIQFRLCIYEIPSYD